jgi:hypothetical protein
LALRRRSAWRCKDWCFRRRGGAAEALRLARWWDEYRSSLGALQLTTDPELPFATRVDYLALGAFGLGRSTGSINRFYRHDNDLARDGDDRSQLLINRGPRPTQGVARSWHAVMLPGAAMLFDFTVMADHVCPGGHNVNALMLPRRLLRQAMPNAEDITGSVIPAGNEALRLLVYYADGLFGDETLSHPAVLAQAGQNLMDLMVLAYGADRDNTEIARLRGLRAARLDAVLRRIRAGYDDPAISPATVAARVGISTRYTPTR